MNFVLISGAEPLGMDPTQSYPKLDNQSGPKYEGPCLNFLGWSPRVTGHRYIDILVKNVHYIDSIKPSSLLAGHEFHR